MPGRKTQKKCTPTEKAGVPTREGEGKSKEQGEFICFDKFNANDALCCMRNSKRKLLQFNIKIYVWISCAHHFMVFRMCRSMQNF